MVAMNKGCLAVVFGALIAVAVAVMLWMWLAPKPTFVVVNVDGQAVDVVPWVGGASTAVPCGQTREINTSGAPGQPWLVTVTASTDHHVLLQQRGSGPLEVIVRRGGVGIGAPPPSVGPAGLGC
jgi:hypothetical protein